MLPEIKTLWIGGDLSRLERVCLASFIANGHKVTLYTYGDVGNIPKGVDIDDANKILDESKVFQYGKATGSGKGSYAGFANYFRYKMLYENENTYWVDTDVICLKPFPKIQEIIFGEESPEFINNAIIGTEKKYNHLFLELCEYCENPFVIQKWDSWKIVLKKIYGRYYGGSHTDYIPWGLTGPKALTGFVKKLDLDSYTNDSRTFYPIPSSDWEAIFYPDNTELLERDLKDSFGLHLWNEHLRRNGIEKNRVFDKDSLYEKLISRFELERY
ncbi:TPA: hypothetical protein ACPVX8_002903 [Vibrio parahaemolyticus]|uniref:Galactosyltransferase n=1 Tax=Vibrio parahaemolyticus TaxID=670 RepID=A0A5P9W9I9_VIBPH|nr:hypothetical protein [Vibrio alginolyticus]EJB1795587.1 hypothetical protein [Vibrio parahaemolyticus]EJG1698239.1 hypothetical protein [Vibrio parahaemolyticus]MCR9541623.1 hypothetical protein [Vibrio alginolyticus]QFX78123.1 galactosyltransferase [Vibrio parahaemolyticus]ULF69090.1 hypothetical protein K6745_01050 [Vibrio alginolyticus]